MRLTVSRHLWSIFVLAFTTLAFATVYGLVSGFSGPVVFAHFVVFWSIWLITVATVSRRLSIRLAPLAAFFLFWMPSPNYWRAILEGDFESVCIAFQMFLGMNGDDANPLWIVLMRSLMFFALVFALTILSRKALINVLSKAN